MIDNIEHILVILCFVVLAVGLSDILPFSNFLASFLSLVEELHQPLVVMLVRGEEALTSLPETLISKLDVVEHLYMLCPQMMIVCLATQTKKQAGIWIYGSKEGQEDGQTEREVDRQRGRQTNRQADKQIDRKTDRETDRKRG